MKRDPLADGLRGGSISRGRLCGLALAAGALFLLSGLPAAGAPPRLGAKATPPEIYESLPVARLPEIVVEEPGKVDFRAFLPEVGDQGAQSSCTGWAVSAVASFYEGIRRGRKPLEEHRIASPAFIYNQINDGRDEGSHLHRALELMRAKGAASLATMPYNDRDHIAAPSVEALVEARHNTIVAYGRLPTRERIRQALALYYPVVVVIQISPLFSADSSHWEIYDAALFEADKKRLQAEARRGGRPAVPAAERLHAVALVGYDDQKRAFLMMNSWGPAWGRGGFAWLSYDLFDTIGSGTDLFAWEAWLLERRRGFSTRAQDALGAHADQRASGVELSSQAWQPREDASSWRWKVSVDPSSPRIEEISQIVWSIEAAGGERQVIATDPELDFRVEGTSFEAGVVEVGGLVSFRDGSKAYASHALLLFREVPPSLDIKTRDAYWGVDFLPDGRRAPLWDWWTSIRFADLQEISHVTWRLPPHFEQPTRTVSDRSSGFRVRDFADRSFKIEATVHFTDGRQADVDRVVELFSSREDELALQVEVTQQGRGADRRYGIGLSLQGPLRDRIEIEKVVYRLPERYGGAVTVANEDGWGEFFWQRDGLIAGKEGAIRFEVRADLFYKDGSPKTLRGLFEIAPG